MALPRGTVGSNGVDTLSESSFAEDGVFADAGGMLPKGWTREAFGTDVKEEPNDDRGDKTALVAALLRSVVMISGMTEGQKEPYLW